MTYFSPRTLKYNRDDLRGMYVPEGALKNWRYSDNTSVRSIFCAGDSTVGNPVTYDAWHERLRRRFGFDSVGYPGEGYYHCNRLTSSGGGEWDYTGTWSQTSTGLVSEGPMVTRECTAANGGTGAVATFTPPTGVDSSQIYLHWVDRAGDFQYSKNAGSTWTNIGASGGSAYKRTAISGPITTSFKVRAYNGSAGVLTNITGIELRTSSSQKGYILHNMGQSGARLFDSFARTTTGDKFAIFGSTILPPDLVIMGPWTNDVITGNGQTDTGYANNWETVYNGIIAKRSSCNFIFLGAHEQANNDGNRPVSDQTAFRAAVKAKAASLGVAYLDIYEAWGSVGYRSAYMADDWHMNDTGHADLSWRIGRMLDTFS